MLGTTPVEQINISNVSIGTAYTGSTLPSGKTEAILIEGKAGTTARLEIGELIFNRNTFEWKYNISNIPFPISGSGFIYSKYLSKFVIFGGCIEEKDNRHSTNNISTLDYPLNKEWKLLNIKLPININSFGYCLINNKYIIIAGGSTFKNNKRICIHNKLYDFTDFIDIHPVEEYDSN